MDKDSLPRVILKPKREFSVKQFHPWIFSGAIEKTSARVENGTLVSVYSHEGEFLGVGHFSSGSIAVKLLVFAGMKVGEDILQGLIKRSVKFREDLGLLGSKDTTAFRLVNAEGDNLPGLVVDLYAKTAVIQCQSSGMEKAKEKIVQYLKEVLRDRLKAVYFKQPKGEEELSGEYLLGRKGDSVVQENGIFFDVDWERGQKTGFFLDQRENRFLFLRYAKGRKVLNAFCYTGGFSMYALIGGATEVCSVDASKSSIEGLEKNILLNLERQNFSNPQHRFIVADCFEFLPKLDQSYDLVVLDPPAFVKHRNAIDRGLRGYETINYQVINQLKPGAILFTFSCSQLVSREAFKNMVIKAGIKAKRQLKIIHELHQAPCHPVSLYHPEGMYLKGLVVGIGA